MSFRLLPVVLALLAAIPAVRAADLPALSGPVRTVPAGTKLAMVQTAGNMQLYVNGAALTLAPGARVRNAQNLFVVPTSVTSRVPARVQLNAEGQISEVWLLSDEEISKSSFPTFFW